MTTANQIIWDDTILPFQLDNADVRGRVARLDGALDEILGQHNYPTAVAGLVAEAVLLTAMIGQTIGLRWKLSLQIRGNGPIRLIATDYFAAERDGEPAKIRAYASFDEERLAEAEGTPFENIGKGMFAVLIDQGAGMQPYQALRRWLVDRLRHVQKRTLPSPSSFRRSFLLLLARRPRPVKIPFGVAAR